MSCGLSHGSVHSILHHDFGLSLKCARWIPHQLTPEQMVKRVEFGRQCLSLSRQRDWLSRIITCDETWISFYDPETKRQSSQWLPTSSTQQPHKLSKGFSCKKVMAIAFFDTQGMIYQHLVQENEKVNSLYYCQVLRKLREHIWRKRPGKKVILHHDNAPPHSAKITCDLVESFKWTTLPHPPYSPDLAPCDFYLFPCLKKHLKGKKFSSIAEIQRELQSYFKQVEENGFQNVFSEWKSRWEKVIQSEGFYFE